MIPRPQRVNVALDTRRGLARPASLDGDVVPEAKETVVAQERASTGPNRSGRLEHRDAIAWLHERGWRPTTPARNLVVVADELAQPPVTLRRIWTNALDVERASRSARGDEVLLIVPVRGNHRFELRAGRTPISVTDGEALLLPLDGIRRVSSPPAFAARIELELHGDVLPVRFAVGHHLELRDLASSPARSALLAVTNAVLSARELPPRAQPYVQDAVVNLVSALVLAHGRSARARPSTHDIYEDAVRLIRDRAVDPSLRVDTIAAALDVSPRHLARVFRAHGTSARSVLAQRRVFLARTALTLSPHLPGPDLARAAGFRTERSLRAALARTAPDTEVSGTCSAITGMPGGRRTTSSKTVSDVGGA